jgi:hypothetical protein
MQELEAIYLVEASNGLVKIGRSSSPKRRLTIMSSGSPLPLKLIHQSLVE